MAGIFYFNLNNGINLKIFHLACYLLIKNSLKFWPECLGYILAILLWPNDILFCFYKKNSLILLYQSYFLI